jgi:hypothetical protein
LKRKPQGVHITKDLRDILGLLYGSFLNVHCGQSWKKLHAAHAVRADIYFRIEDILVQKSRTYVAIEDLCGDFEFVLGEY